MVIQLAGHLDTEKVTDVKKMVDERLQGIEAAEHIVIDCSELDYISSSGLRLLLAVKKRFPNTDVLNVNDEIYHVFEMTGFVRIINVVRAKRKINLDSCELIGEGGNGAVYRINAEEIVKIGKFPQRDDELKRESEQVREAFIMGVPTIISFDTVDCDGGRKGIVMEALDSQSLGQYIAEDPSRMDAVIPQYVDLFRQTNAIETDSPLFRNTKEWLRSLLYLPQRIINDEEAALMSSVLDEIPDSKQIVHFDGHVGNVLMHGAKDDRSLVLIDLGDTGVGHPVLDIAGWAFMMLEPEYAKGCSPSKAITGMSYEQNRVFCRKVLAEMFHVTDDAELDMLVDKAQLIGFIKAAYVAQRWASVVQNEEFRVFLNRLVRETITRASEIKSAIRMFVERL